MSSRTTLVRRSPSMPSCGGEASGPRRLGSVGATALAAALALIGHTGAAAQQAPVLTLDDALRIAEGNNPTYRQAVNDVTLNAVEWRTAWADRLLPRVGLNLFSTTFTGNRRDRALDNFGNPIENPGAGWNYFSQSDQRLSLTWGLQGRSLFQSLDRQRLTNEGRDVAAGRAVAELRGRVQRLYLDALEQRELARTEDELVEARRVDLQVAERLFGLALRTRVDVLNAELAVEQQALQARQQQTALERALLALRTELGREGVVDLELADEPLPIFDPAGLDADALVRLSGQENPELRQAEVGLRTARLGLDEQRNGWWPRLDFGINFYRRSYLPHGEALFQPWPGTGLEQQFYAQLSLPFFDSYFQNRQGQHRADVAFENSVESERATRLRIEQTVRGAVLELSNQWESLRIAERSVQIAEEALRLAREEYRIGTLSFEELRAAFDNEAVTRRQVIVSRHAFVDALLSLEEAVGTPVRAGVPPLTPPSGGR